MTGRRPSLLNKESRHAAGLASGGLASGGLASGGLASGVNAYADAGGLERFEYDNKSVLWFVWFALLWGAVGMLVGVVIAAQLAGMGTRWGYSWLNEGILGFGRLRPLHTNAVIFGFTGNAIFAGAYYAMQRVLKARTWSSSLTLV